MKRIVLTALILAMAASCASAQGWQKGKTYIGPTLGLVYKGFGIGGAVDHALDKNWGIGGEIAYTTFSDKYSYAFYNYEWKYTFVGVLACGSYHFIVKSNRKIDPYIKGGLGYFNWSADYTDNYGNQYRNLYDAGYSSGLGVALVGGIKYFFSPGTAGRFQVGFPFYLSVGVDFVI